MGAARPRTRTCGDPSPAQPDAFGEIGHPEVVRAIAGEHAAHLDGAEPVRIGLDDREDLALGADQPPHGPEVVRGGVEIDLEHGRPERNARHGEQHIAPRC